MGKKSEVNWLKARIVKAGEEINKSLAKLKEQEQYRERLREALKLLEPEEGK